MGREVTSNWSLIGKDGQRKYLVNGEYEAFMSAVASLKPYQRAFCETMAGCGGRISEVLALRKSDIDRQAGAITLRTLKKKGGKIEHRQVPVSPELITKLDMVFDLSRGKQEAKLWNVNVRNARRWVMKAMEAAGLNHPPHALRHTFGAHCTGKGIPIGTIRKWMGHSFLDTTTIYTDLCGEEEKELAKRMWR